MMDYEKEIRRNLSVCNYAKDIAEMIGTGYGSKVGIFKTTIPLIRREKRSFRVRKLLLIRYDIRLFVEVQEEKVRTN